MTDPYANLEPGLRTLLIALLSGRNPGVVYDAMIEWSVRVESGLEDEYAAAAAYAERVRGAVERSRESRAVLEYAEARVQLAGQRIRDHSELARALYGWWLNLAAKRLERPMDSELEYTGGW